MKTCARSLVALTALSVASLLPVSPAEAQVRSMTWTQVTQVEMPGTLGAVLRVTGALDERRSEHAIHIHGRTMRQDDGSTSVIFDAEGRRFITIDHDQQTYMEVTFEESVELAREMGELMAEARAGADDALREAEAERDEALAELRRAMDEMEETMNFSLRSEATGERRSFGEFSAERHVIIGEVEATGEIEGMEDAEGGSLAFVVELWQSQDFPDEAAFMEEWATALAEDPAMQALAADFAEALEPVTGESGAELLAVWDPRIAAGVKRMAEAMESLDGTTLASRTVIAVVEPGASLDQSELIAWEPASMGDQLRAGAGEAARGAAQEAARGALRGLTRGVLGRGGDEPEAAEEAPRVRPLVSIRSARENPLFQTSSAAGENPLFGELDSYRPISLADLIREATEPG